MRWWLLGFSGMLLMCGGIALAIALSTRPFKESKAGTEAGVSIFERGASIAEIEAKRPPFPKCIPPTVSIGMSREDLLERCGPPSAISHQYLPGKDREQYSYRRDGVFVYMTNGQVDAMQYAEGNEHFRWDERR